MDDNDVLDLSIKKTINLSSNIENSNFSSSINEKENDCNKADTNSRLEDLKIVNKESSLEAVVDMDINFQYDQLNATRNNLAKTNSAAQHVLGIPNSVMQNNATEISSSRFSNPVLGTVVKKLLAHQLSTHKIVLRRQLNQALVDLPLPVCQSTLRHMTFLPSPTCCQYLSLIGLGEVVNNIIKSKSRQFSTNGDEDKEIAGRGDSVFSDELPPPVCSVCFTDFTPVWYRDTEDNVLCETCHVDENLSETLAPTLHSIRQLWKLADQKERALELEYENLINDKEKLIRFVSGHELMKRILNPVASSSGIMRQNADNMARSRMSSQILKTCHFPSETCMQKYTDHQQSLIEHFVQKQNQNSFETGSTIQQQCQRILQNYLQQHYDKNS